MNLNLRSYMKNTKYIFITGGVVSSLGKGITSSTIGRLLKSRGLKIYMQKFDPYLNYDPSMMSPFQHGEVFVTHDGGQADLDLGHYERFTNELVNKNSNITTGKIYSRVIEKERKGYYNGGTVQVIPHITDEILSFLKKAQDTGADVVITEIGGTVGDIEGLPYLEAIRQAKKTFGPNNTFYVHCTLVPYLKSAGEIKTKPTQHSVKELRSIGITPNMIVLRSEMSIPKREKAKIALFCDVDEKAVIEANDVEIVYDLVNKFHEQGVDDIICETLNINTTPADLTNWNEMIEKIRCAKGNVKIATVGKYVGLKDAYLSVYESLEHACNWMGKKSSVKRIDSDKIAKDNVDELLGNVDGILVPDGIGVGNIEGIILASEYARKNNIPYLGIGLGMQTSLIEIARNLGGLTNANSVEFDSQCSNPIITYFNNHLDVDMSNNILRLGDYEIDLMDSKVKDLYGKDLIKERHRNRFEFNSEYKDLLEKNGVQFVGYCKTAKSYEIIEYTPNDWFVACLYHPEFLSRPNHPHPLFKGFIKAAISRKK